MNEKVMRHAALCDELNALYERKNHDYGDSFHQTFVEEGMAMPRIRLGDKFSRFKTLSQNGDQQVSDESIRDTLMDLANYSLMTILEMDISNEETEAASGEPIRGSFQEGQPTNIDGDFLRRATEGFFQSFQRGTSHDDEEADTEDVDQVAISDFEETVEAIELDIRKKAADDIDKALLRQATAEIEENGEPSALTSFLLSLGGRSHDN